MRGVPVIGVAEVTRALLAAPPPSVDNGVRDRLRDDLSTGIAPLVECLAPGEQIVVTLPTLRQALVRPDSLMQPDEPFVWKPVFVRRSLGLEVVSACATRRFRAPAEGVGPVADEAVADWERTGWRRFYWEPWLAGLAPGSRAMVLAEAVNWATSLWSSLDWKAVSPPPHIGGTDDRWTCPAARAVCLRGRCEVRVPLAQESTGTGGGDSVASPTALVSLSSGCPGPTWPEELAYLALVAGLRSPARPVPARVVGLWPDAGAYRVAEVNEQLLAAAADRTVATVGVMADAARTGAERR
jgi:hypothetical protein